MRIDCEQCGKAMQVPDDKLPAGVFALTCPGCQNKITVDPQAAQPMAPPATAREDPDGTDRGAGLRSLRSNELELFEQMTPLAVVVDLEVPPDPSLDAQLKLAGMKEVRHLRSLAEAVEVAEDLEAGLLVIRMSKAPAPPCQPLEPLYRMPSRARRRTFTALVADNVRTLDGQVAFYLQVNCLLNAQEVAGMAVPLRRALLYHLKHYRHWWDTQDKH